MSILTQYEAINSSLDQTPTIKNLDYKVINAQEYQQIRHMRNKSKKKHLLKEKNPFVQKFLLSHMSADESKKYTKLSEDEYQIRIEKRKQKK